MDWKDKAWGKYRITSQTENSIIVQNVIRRGGYCSVHHHHHHSNTFLVEEGTLHVAEYSASGLATKVHQIQSGHGLVLPSLTWHQFFAKDDCVIWEWYQLMKRFEQDVQFASIGDIVRREGMSMGGVRENYPYENVPHVWA